MENGMETGGKAGSDGRGDDGKGDLYLTQPSWQSFLGHLWYARRSDASMNQVAS